MCPGPVTLSLCTLGFLPVMGRGRGGGGGGGDAGRYFKEIVRITYYVQVQFIGRFLVDSVLAASGTCCLYKFLLLGIVCVTGLSCYFFSFVNEMKS